MNKTEPYLLSHCHVRAWTNGSASVQCPDAAPALRFVRHRGARAVRPHVGTTRALRFRCPHVYAWLVGCAPAAAGGQVGIQ